MRRNRAEMLNDLDIALALIDKARDELGVADTDSLGNVITACNGEYSLAKVKRNCTTARDLLLGVRKGCDYE